METRKGSMTGPRKAVPRPYSVTVTDNKLGVFTIGSYTRLHDARRVATAAVRCGRYDIVRIEHDGTVLETWRKEQPQSSTGS